MDSFFLGIFSYGDDRNIYAVDIMLSHQMLMEPLRALAHIPKIIIVQVCVSYIHYTLLTLYKHYTVCTLYIHCRN